MAVGGLRIRALDHAIESIYSAATTRQRRGGVERVTMLLRHLRPSLDTNDPRVLEHRVECQWPRGCACSA